jgi:hypothetical protein
MNTTKVIGIMALAGVVIIPATSNAQNSVPFYGLNPGQNSLVGLSQINVGLENYGAVGYNTPTVANGVLTLSGVPNTSAASIPGGGGNWYGVGVATTQAFNSGTAWDISVDRVSLTGGPSGNNYGVYAPSGSSQSRIRSSIIITQTLTPGPNGAGSPLPSSTVYWSQDIGETGWEYNAGGGGGRGQGDVALDGTPVGGGSYGNGSTIQPSSAFAYDGGNVQMEVTYTPNGGTSATFSFYANGIFAGSETENNWNNSAPFYVILDGMARTEANGDEVAGASFTGLTVTPEPGTLALGGLGLGAMWLFRRNKRS